MGTIPRNTGGLEDEIEGHGEVKNLMKLFFQKSMEKDGLKYEPSNILTGDSLPQDFDDGTEMSRNREILDEVFENDMVLTVDQMMHLIDDLQEDSFRAETRHDPRRHKRKVMESERYRWKSTTIPFSFSLSDAATQEKIRAALRHWESKTCLRFVENGQGADSLSFFRGAGCYSNVGRTGRRQSVSIGNGCEVLGIIAHEVGHALGFWHEQSRPDRDRYIWINSHNLIQGTNPNFERRDRSEVTDFGIPYDMGSVMHYGPKSFTTNWDKRTIDTRDPNYRNTIGQRVETSFIDAKLINEAYCSDKCTRKLNCKHNGYTNPNRCNECVCPFGLSGNCDKVERSKSNCGGELRATYEWQTVKNPTFAQHQDCKWRISVSL